MSNEQVQWLLKVIQPERTLAALPGGASFGQDAHAALLGVATEIYAAELELMRTNVLEAANRLLADPEVVSMVDRLPLQKGDRVTVFGDSLTSDYQSWAVILGEILAIRRPKDEISWTIRAIAGETTTHALVRAGQIAESEPDWVLILLGTNDARTQGSFASKTLVHHEETARNIAELRQRIAKETTAKCLWITPPAVDEAQVAAHWGLARFGVRFRNEDLERVAGTVRAGAGQVIDAFSSFGSPPPADLLTDDGLHLSLAGQQLMALEVIRGWSTLK